MRKHVCLSFLLALAVFFTAQSQTLVGTDPTNANVVLEEYTGIHCQYCPDGHTRAQTIFDQNPGRIVLVNIHQGGYAVPSGGEPDYRTPFGDALAGQINLNGYPTATVNRHVFAAYSDNPGGTAMGRGYWSAASQEALMAPSPVNVGLSSTFDTLSRLLTVTVEAYYTAASPQATNYINVALLESGIIGPQQILSVWNTNYTHNHMLRHFLTGQWGDTLTATGVSDFTTRVYTYTVPAGYDVSKCDVAAYITETHQQVYTGAQVPAMGGTTLITATVTPPTPAIELGSPATTTDFTMTANSGLAGAEDFSFELISDAPADWAVDYSVGGTHYTVDDTLSLTGGATVNLGIHVTPGTTPFIGTFTLIMRSISNPMAPAIYTKVILISNITDLVLNNDAPWGDGANTYSAAGFESNYMKGLAAAGNTTYASTPVKTLMEVAAAGKLTEVEHIYFNVSWAFPSFTDNLVAMLGGFLDNGGNLLVAGQDAAWDTWDLTNGGNGTVNTQAFYTNYLHCAFVADGGAANSIMTPLNSDLVFTQLDTSAIVNVYGGAYFYPDQIDTVGTGSLPLYYYNSNLTKMGGLRYTNGTYKVVYLGVGIEMISDTNVRKDIVHIAHDWFHGYISGAEEYDQAMAAAFLGQNYPNPADGFTNIPYSEASEGSVMMVYDLMGNLVWSAPIEKGSTHIYLQTAQWTSGMYTYRMINADGNVLTKKIIITH